MPGAGRSEVPAVSALGTVVGYLIFGWSFNGSGALDGPGPTIDVWQPREPVDIAASGTPRS